MSDYESVLRHPETKEFLDICKRCLPDTGIIPMEPKRYQDDYNYEDDEEYTDEILDNYRSGEEFE